MNSKRHGLDEMQKGRRDSIGNQMFMLLFYALLINGGLYGMGITWLPYPVNVMVIITACMGVYLVRLIAANAYLSSAAQNRKGIAGLLLAILFSIGLGAAAIFLFRQSSMDVAHGASDQSAQILVIVSVVGLLAALIAAVIRRANNRGGADE